MTAEDRKYLNFAIALEERAIRKGHIKAWRETSCFPLRKKGCVIVTLPSDKHPKGKVERRVS